MRELEQVRRAEGEREGGAEAEEYAGAEDCEEGRGVRAGCCLSESCCTCTSRRADSSPPEAASTRRSSRLDASYRALDRERRYAHFHPPIAKHWTNTATTTTNEPAI